MASLLNNASLLLNPAGSIISYQEDTIYSVLPKNGTGDFTFSGGDGGTRVNQQGYIEQTPANLMTYSEAVADWDGNLFNNWIPNAVTSNSVIAPNGTLTADRIGDGYGRFNKSATAIPSQTYTYSVYLKNVSLSANFYIYVAWGLNGTLVSYTTVGGQINVGALSTTEWTRFTFTATAPSSGINQMQFGPCPFTGYGTNPSGQQLDVWGGMINIGSTAFPYQPTTDRLNYPRITYQNGRGALLQEPARTNLLTYSNGFDLWSYAGITVTTGSAISPDGTQNAVLLTTTNATNHQLFQAKNASGALAYSVWAKKGNSRTFYLAAYNNNFAAYWDLNTGAVISTAGSGVSALPGEQYIDGWMRYTMLFTNIAVEVQIGFLDTYYTGNSVAPWTVSTSVGTTGYIYGAQLEAGEFPTTYIPTTSATVTRPIEQFFKNDSPALNTTSWTFYMSGVNIGKNQNASGNPIDAPNWSFDSGAGPYGANSIHNYNNTVYYYDTVNGAAFLGAIGNTTTKFAVTKNGTTFKFFRDGVLTTTSTLSLASNVWDSFRMYGDVDGQGQAFSNNPSTLAILPSALSDSDAQTLTTVRSGSGGNISYYGPYTIHTFTGSATFTPSFTGPVEVLVVAGGAGGGSGFNRSACGGGGGAGGLQYVSSYGVSAGTGITVTIGAGGAGGPAGTGSPTGDGSNGSNSVFGGITTIGGGGGTTYFDTNGKNGGSGGGAGGAGGYTPVGGQGIPGQGNNGGNQVGSGQSTDTTSCGGGGGAGAVGANGVTSQRGGNGGIGLPYSISGFSTYYAGGGGGGASQVGGGFGGLGGGANGGNLDSNGSSGVNYTGGGGGGASSGVGVAATAGGTGGSGIVIVRYLT